MNYVRFTKRCKIGLLFKQFRILASCMLNFKIYSFGQFRAPKTWFRAPKTWFRAGHFGHARNPARNLDARNLAHPAYDQLIITDEDNNENANELMTRESFDCQNGHYKLRGQCENTPFHLLSSYC